MGGAEQKAASFILLIGMGYLLRGKLKDKKAIMGIRGLIMHGLLPAVIFKGLVGVRLDWDTAFLPGVNLAHIAVQLLVGMAVATIVSTGQGLHETRARATLAFMSSTFAPGLSAFVFIKEFAPTAMGMGALMDLSSKFYLLVILPALMRPVYGAEESASPAKVHAGPTLAATVAAAAEPLNLAILAGLGMSLLGLSVASLGPLGAAVDLLASAQSPVLFIFLGLSISAGGAGPIICVCLARAAVAQVSAHGIILLLGLGGDEALALTLMFQSAASVVGLAQLEKAAAAGNNASHTELALNLVSYSFPVSIAYQVAAAVFGESYVDRLPQVAAASAAAAVGVALIGLGASPTKPKAA